MPDETKIVHAGLRLSIRKEGTFVNAYIAPENGWHNVEIIGSIKTEALDMDSELFELWRRLMQYTAGTLIKKRTGVEPVWPNEATPAPEHERSGSA